MTESTQLTEAGLDRELRVGAQYLAQCLNPESGAIPRIPNVDIYGISIPYNGIAGGDLITYVDFSDRYDLDARIARAEAQGRGEVAQKLQRLKRKGGVLVADVAGHEYADAMRALLLHQIFHTSALYELDLHGEITAHLFEQINQRFFKSTTLHKLAGERGALSFITLIYGEISSTGRFRFICAGHPQPLVFSREYDRFVEISPDRLVSFPPIGLQLSEDDDDVRMFPRVLGYKKRYTVNELNLMGRGDVLLLYSDGLVDPFSPYSQDRLERAVSAARDGSAEDICRGILADRHNAARPDDDLSLVVIKYQ
ncbi:MAG: PP2C family protein-serine/threonine phosphatase [Acidobacteriota bacterium]|jgi:serine phosphatase RsbU (regulator of sigma subunit)|nr:PP2C family protein-serine/threonine phosphatase [Acidobacteriota bacterium]NLT32831.1 serine/threonine-protein phosphatase [Acidobacteriota bacterium]